jgi:hypothetical protein
MILGGTSKSNKSWCLLDLALSVASGEKWWGRRCVKKRVETSAAISLRAFQLRMTCDVSDIGFCS